MNDHALVFTDVVDSTAWVERLGDRGAAELWAEHDRRARELLARHRGREIDRADGVFALFAEAADAARYALAYHDALAPLQLRARCGVHVGTVTLRDNRPEDVARGAKPIEVEGRAKPLAARVMALASGGQTLLTDAARQALGAAPPSGSALKSHGHYRLKGIDAPIEVFEIGRGDRAAFEPPADADKAYRVVRRHDLWIPLREVRHNLPAERDSFVDRVHEMRALVDRIDAGTRLITVVGVGGTGKTRFARRGGWRLLGDWPGGVYFCDLSEARTLEGVLSAVAVALGTPLSALDPAQQIGHAIAGRGRCLVILDNFEQVVAFAPDTLGRWLDRAGDAAFVVTSRERLNLRGEEVFALEPLPPHRDAIDLFADRARAHNPAFVLDDAARPTIGRIAELVDGLPLAIELAAARCRMLAPAQLLERLHSRFQLLGGMRGMAARQATLKATIDWSWQLLTPWEQAALAQCSVFEGPFTLGAAEAVIDASAWRDAPAALDIVQALVDKSLLKSATGAAAQDEPAFGMYLSVREFAAERLDAAGAAARAGAEQRHARHYAALGTPDALLALDRSGGAVKQLAMARDLDNLVTACRRAMRRNDADCALPLYRAIGEVVQRQGPFTLADALGSQMLALSALSGPQRALVEYIRAFALLRNGRQPEARAGLERALELARAHPEPFVESRALAGLSWLAELQGRPADARALAAQVLQVCRQAGDPRTEGMALSSLAFFAHQDGRLDESRALYEQSLAIHRKLANLRDEAGPLWRSAVLFAEQGQLQEARARFERALAIAEELQDRVVQGEVLTNLGSLHHEQHDPERARQCFERALVIHRDTGNRRWEACALGALGQVQCAQGRLDEAERTTRTAHQIAHEIGDRHIEGSELGNLADVLFRQGRIAAARATLLQAEALLRSIGARIYLGLALCTRAELEHGAGDAAAARAARDEAQAAADAMHLGADADLVRRIVEVTALLDAPPTTAP
jgi:predicted ATPase/class 3 adenylate cyclase/Tfp pilus assembly protein PilF